MRRTTVALVLAAVIVAVTASIVTAQFLRNQVDVSASVQVVTSVDPGLSVDPPLVTFTIAGGPLLQNEVSDTVEVIVTNENTVPLSGLTVVGLNMPAEIALGFIITTTTDPVPPGGTWSVLVNVFVANAPTTTHSFTIHFSTP